MGWLVKVAHNARVRYMQLDPHLREEMCEHVAAVAERPKELLRRARSGIDTYLYDYRSGIDEHLVFSLAFGDYDPASQTLTLVTISDKHDAPGVK